MSTKLVCTQLTCRGKPCRNRAVPGTNPPRCTRHRATAGDGQADAPQPYLRGLSPEETTARNGVAVLRAVNREPVTAAARPGEATPQARQRTLPGLSPEELDARDRAAHVYDELAKVRNALRWLEQQLDDPEQPASPEEMRRLTALIFSGARTVAHLLAVQAKQPDTNRDWMTRALERFGNEYGLAL